MRSEAGAVLEALDEAIRIGREAKIPVEIWHVKAAGKRNWGRMKEIVAKIEAGAPRRRRHHRRHLRLPRLVQFLLRVHPSVGARRRRRAAAGAPEGSRRRGSGSEKDMLSPDDKGWDNEWQEIPGPEAVLIGAVQNAELKSIQGKTLAEIAALWKMDPIDTIFEILIKDHAFTYVAVFGMSEPDVALAVAQPWVSFNNDSQGTAPTGILGQAAPAPARLRHVPARVPQVRPRGQAADAGGGGPQDDGAPGAEDAPRRPRRAEGRHVGRRGRVRSGDDRRRGDLRAAEPVVGRHGLRAGQRRARDRRRQSHRRAARQGAARRRAPDDRRARHRRGHGQRHGLRRRRGRHARRAGEDSVQERRLDGRGVYHRDRRRRPDGPGSASRRASRSTTTARSQPSRPLPATCSRSRSS